MKLFGSVKRFCRKGNTLALIYLAWRTLILFVIGALIGWYATGSKAVSALAGFVLMLGIGELVLSSVGERHVRRKYGCREITDPQQRARLVPLFREVYDKAKQEEPSLPDDIELFWNEDTVPNGFATGRKTICLTAGMIAQPEHLIKATLAHEFGHLAHRDTDLTLLVATSGEGSRLLCKVQQVLYNITIGGMKMLMLALGGLEGLFFFRMMDGLGTAGIKMTLAYRRLCDRIVTIMLMHSSRAQEFAADEFAFRIGYGNALCELLDTVFGQDDPETELFAILARSHPQHSERIACLQALGASYQVKYIA